MAVRTDQHAVVQNIVGRVAVLVLKLNLNMAFAKVPSTSRVLAYITVFVQEVLLHAAG